MKNIALCCCETTGIEIKGDPVINAICHCANCKKRTGSAFGISVYFKNAQVINTFGETTLYEICETNHQQRYFCKKCGTTLYWTMTALPGFTGIAGGCFPDNTFAEPEYTVSNEGKCAWLALPEHMRSNVTKQDFIK